MRIRRIYVGDSVVNFEYDQQIAICTRFIFGLCLGPKRVDDTRIEGRVIRLSREGCWIDVEVHMEEHSGGCD